MANGPSTPLSQVDRQADGLHLLHIFEVTAEQSGEVKCVARCGNEQAVCHTDLAVFPEIYKAFDETNDDVDGDNALVPFDCQELDFDNDPDNICPAYIICGPQDCTALIGGQVVLEVVYGGHPEPTIKWLKAVSYCHTECQGNAILWVGWLAG